MRLIDADALRDAMYHEAFETDSDMQKWDSGCWIQYKMFQNQIENAPTIEPRHGKWIKDGVSYSLYKCTACNDLCTVAGYADCIPEKQMYRSFKFCPNCGAKMEGEEDEL